MGKNLLCHSERSEEPPHFAFAFALVLGMAEDSEAIEKSVLLKGTASAVPKVHCSQRGFSSR